MKYIFLILLVITAILLILLVLIQRGRGGGLAGAFGGLGGQSAFGAKAGDTFTRITIGVATFWILLCIVALAYFRWTQRSRLDLGPTLPSATATSGPLQPTDLPPAPGAPSNSAVPSGGSQSSSTGSQGGPAAP